MSLAQVLRGHQYSTRLSNFHQRTVFCDIGMADILDDTPYPLNVNSVYSVLQCIVQVYEYIFKANIYRPAIQISTADEVGGEMR